jgi:hypothetical protein
MQAKSLFAKSIKFYWKILFYFENMFATVLKCIVEFYKNLEICLNAFGAQMLEL